MSMLCKEAKISKAWAGDRFELLSRRVAGLAIKIRSTMEETRV
jgi:hypothetical protein